jgi:hypothetical protein
MPSSRSIDVTGNVLRTYLRHAYVRNRITESYCGSGLFTYQFGRRDINYEVGRICNTRYPQIQECAFIKTLKSAFGLLAEITDYAEMARMDARSFVGQ